MAVELSQLRRAVVPSWSRGRPRLTSLLWALLSRPAVKPSPPDVARGDKALSLQLEVRGLTLEVRAKRFEGVLGLAAGLLAVAAVLQELARPPQFRTWHGRLGGLIPYDFRRPTFRRFLTSLWAPDNPRLLTDTAFGVGWAVNLAHLPRLLLGGTRAAVRPYIGPRATR